MLASSPTPPSFPTFLLPAEQSEKRAEGKWKQNEITQKHLLSLASACRSAALPALDAFLSPVTWQHCHGNQVWVIICAMTPILQWRWGRGRRWRNWAGVGGGWNENRRGRGAAGTQTETKSRIKTIFLSFDSRDRTYLSFRLIGRAQKRQTASLGIMIGGGWRRK